MLMADRPSGRGKRNYRADGEALRYYRDVAHLTLEELEKAAGVSYTTISRIETGKIVSPRWPTLRQLANALGVKVESIVIHDAPASLRPGGATPRPDVPEEPGATAENEARMDDVRQDKERRDRETRGEKNASDTGDRAS